MKKEGCKRKITFEKKKTPGLIRVMGQPGLAELLHWPVF
jgi:hypothetical protein